MKQRLCLIRTKNGRAWESGSVLCIGRETNQDIVLDHRSVSRHHAQIRNADGGWWILDLFSTNGTCVNGKRLGRSARQLKARDVVQIGKIAFTVAILEAPESSGRTDPIAMRDPPLEQPGPIAPLSPTEPDFTIWEPDEANLPESYQAELFSATIDEGLGSPRRVNPETPVS